ncbi:MAG: DUF1800 family protein [Saprospiraceae bacterium]|nr:DUF1800 family protein [Saprospiraceae bacterium]
MKNVILFFSLFFIVNVGISQNSLDKYNGPFGEYQLKHLLRRTLFGATMDDMKHFEGKSMDAVVDELLNTDPSAPPPPWSFQFDYGDSESFKTGKTWVGTKGERSWTETIMQFNVSYWWHNLMMKQDRNIREKMVLFYENHIPSNNGKNNIGQGLFYYNRIKLLREHATGNYKDLMKKVTLEPSMMYYLDMNFSFVYKYYSYFVPPVKKKEPLFANENYARELQELYTVGKGRENNEVLFTEDDVKAAARVLSGWCVCNNNVDVHIKKHLCKDTVSYTSSFTPEMHDANDKQFSGLYGNHIIKAKPGPNGGLEEIDELFDMLLGREESARNLVRKLYRFFVYAYITEKTENEVIKPLAILLLQGGNGYKPYDVKPVLKALFTSTHFYDTEQIGCMIKNPYDLILGMSRMMGVKIYEDTDFVNTYNSVSLPAMRSHQQAQFIRSLCFQSGMVVSNVPDVAGYPAYYQGPDYHRLWINADYLRARKQSIHYYSEKHGTFIGFLTMSEFLTDFTINQDPIVIKFAEKLETPSNIEEFIDQNIQYFLVKDLNQQEKDKLSLILNSRNEAWLTTWNNYKANKNNYGTLYHKLREFYDALFSYAEFQLM